MLSTATSVLMSHCELHANHVNLVMSRGFPSKVHPFSKGIYRNLIAFCCSCDDKHKLEAVPPVEDVEARAQPYTCIDVISCRCC